MDAPLISLPPLNSHPIFSVIVNATQIIDPNRPSPSSSISFRFKLKVEFYSDPLLKGKYFTGLNVSVYIDIHRAMSPAASKALISDFLKREELVQFQLSGTTYSETCTSTNHEGIRVDKFLMSTDDLVDCFNDFLRKGFQDDIAREVTLEITKKVLMPDSEFNEWISYIEQQTATSEKFKHAFENAINRPRTQEELLDEAMSYSKKKSTSAAMDEELKDMVLLDEDEESSCVVCLEEFHRESKLKTLPCSHVFHEECIVRWFETNDMCPVCRDKLPVVSHSDDTNYV